MDYEKMKHAIDTDAARSFRGQSTLELDGMLYFLRKQIIDAEWEITRYQRSISAYQAVIDKIEGARKQEFGIEPVDKRSPQNLAAACRWLRKPSHMLDQGIELETKQAKIDHPLAYFGYRRPPHWLWMRSRRAYIIVAAMQDIWLILTGRCSIHKAWQAGHNHGAQQEYERTVIRGGR